MGEFFGNNKIIYDHIRAPIVSEFALYFIQSECPLEVNPGQIEHLRSSNGVDRQIHEYQPRDGIHWHPTRSWIAFGNWKLPVLDLKLGIFFLHQFFLHQNFCFFLHQNFCFFLHQNFCFFYTNFFYTKIFAFFYTKIFAFLHQNFCFFYTKIFAF